MLDLQKIAPSAKSSRSKVAEHIRDRPLSDPDKENKRQNHKFYFPLFKQLTNWTHDKHFEWFFLFKSNGFTTVAFHFLSIVQICLSFIHSLCRLSNRQSWCDPIH